MVLFAGGFGRCSFVRASRQRAENCRVVCNTFIFSDLEKYVQFSRSRKVSRIAVLFVMRSF